ncbi:DNA-processing protein DprA [bacterium]|nr:DNA-processing protein DprA [bacterium]
MSDPRALLLLASVPGVGQKTLLNLVTAFGTAGAVLSADIGDLMQRGGLDRKSAESLKNGRDESFADEQLRLAEKHGIQIVTIEDDAYPPLLKSIYDPPAFLYVRGNPDILHTHTLAVVGMRACSVSGREIAERFAAELAGEGITIVSGLARGVDTAAHTAALRAEGNTAAVLGCGVDYIYPPENARLYEEIVERGAVISELPIGTVPLPGFFPRRNRIISGLSLGTLVVEAGPKSGSLITALLALDQGREVFAVPGSIQSMKSRGTHQLIRQGAKLVETKEDILMEIPQLNRNRGGGQRALFVEDRLSDNEKAVWMHLGYDPVHIDQLAENAGKPVPEVLAILLRLELEGFVRQSAGKLFTRR